MSNNYINKWSKIITDAKVMLEKKNYDAYNNLMDEAHKIFESYKLDNDLTYSCNNFGMSNYIFEDALPKLFKSNKSAVKEFIQTIKEDKNLLAQFNFFKALEKYNPSLDVKDYINESLSLVGETINVKTLKESNMKLANIIAKYGIKPNDFIPESNLKLYENCDYLFGHKKKLTNLNDYNQNINTLVEYVSKNYNHISESKENWTDLVETFNKKYSNLLNEEEKSLVKDIMDWRSDGVNENKKALFNKFKNECINTVNKLLDEAKENDKEGLLSIKEQLMNKEFCQETLVKDIAKLLEIRDVLMSE